jgi:predicted 3-demethylubiquinone-9 3-methyltransferase (glyoxalase superfamily)
MQTITPFLWFDNKAEQAAKFYVGIFKNSKILGISRNGDAGPGRKGSVMVVDFQIAGQRFQALNGGPVYKISPAISFVVDCADQDEVDHFWNKLSAGGKKVQCGWLQDKFGVSWQIVPRAFVKMMNDKNPEKVGRVFAAMMKMKKLDIKVLQKAYDGRK